MKPLPLIAVLYVGLAVCLAQQVPQFVIRTNKQFGLSKGDDFYTLGTKLEDFRARFGRPEKSEKDDSDDGYLAHTVTDYYVKDGLMVTANRDGRIIGFIFYLIPSPILKVAQAATDRGIAAGATEREITKLYGDPYRKKEYKDDVFERTLFYKYGESVLSFRFKDATLQAISLNADYLPYLAK